LDWIHSFGVNLLIIRLAFSPFSLQNLPNFYYFLFVIFFIIKLEALDLLHYKIDKRGMTKYSCSIKARSKRSLEKNKRSKNKLEI
jgi:hypothetical protein